MSLLGFNKIISGFDSASKSSLKEMMIESRKEFDSNFNNQKDSETNKSWKGVKRPVPPPILNVTSKLKGEATRTGRVIYAAGKATLTIDPIDSRGRGYAEYHQDGFKHKQAGFVEPRKYVSHSSSLDAKHLQIIRNNFDPLFP